MKWHASFVLPFLDLILIRSKGQLHRWNGGSPNIFAFLLNSGIKTKSYLLPLRTAAVVVTVGEGVLSVLFQLVGMVITYFLLLVQFQGQPVTVGCTCSFNGTNITFPGLTQIY